MSSALAMFEILIELEETTPSSHAWTLVLLEWTLSSAVDYADLKGSIRNVVSMFRRPAC